MPRRFFQPLAVRYPYTAGGPINLELSPTVGTITELVIVVNANVTTTATPGSYDDPWDRIISSLTLSGEGKTFFSFTNLRAAKYFFDLRNHGEQSPDDPGASQTNYQKKVIYRLHFGVCPNKLNAVTGCVERNPFDLTAGIPPMSKGNLTLQGTFGAANAPGSGWTVNDASIDVMAAMVMPIAGDSPDSYLPRAFPRWEMSTPTPTATSTRFGTTYNIPSGDFLHSILLMTTMGANDPRSDQVLQSVRVYNQLEALTIWSSYYWKHAEIYSQHDIVRWPPTSNPSATNPAQIVINEQSYMGILWLPLHQQVVGGHPLYGVDLRNVATGDLQINYEVLNASGVNLYVVHGKYQLNPNHPANAGA